MTERNFTLELKYSELTASFSEDFHTRQGQIWDIAYFHRIPDILENLDSPIAVLSSRTNFTDACSSPWSFYRSPTLLWDCISVATVALLVEQGNDTVDETAQREADEEYLYGQWPSPSSGLKVIVGSMKDFHKLDVLTAVRDCALASCSDPRFGSCADEIASFRDVEISLDNLAAFGGALGGPYCDTAQADIDFDIAGQGVITSYIIQYIVVFSLALCFKVASSWISKMNAIVSLFLPRKHDHSAPATPRWLRFVSENRLVRAIASTIIDLQEAQAVFVAVIAVATLASFAGGGTGTGLSSILTLPSWIVNHRILQGLITAGVYPVFLIQLVLHRHGNRWWYTMFLTLLDWALLLAVSRVKEVDASSFQDHLIDNAPIEACGHNPGPMSFCQGEEQRKDLNFFTITIWGRVMAHVIAGFLILDWVIHIVRYYWKRANTEERRATYRFLLRRWPRLINSFRAVESFSTPIAVLWVVEVSWILVQFLTVAMMGISLWESIRLLEFHMTAEEQTPWSFGQLIAVTVWLPLLFKFVSLVIDGLKLGVDKRIDDHYEVRLRTNQGPLGKRTNDQTRHESQAAKQMDFDVESNAATELLVREGTSEGTSSNGGSSRQQSRRQSRQENESAR